MCIRDRDNNSAAFNPKNSYRNAKDEIDGIIGIYPGEGKEIMAWLERNRGQIDYEIKKISSLKVTERDMEGLKDRENRRDVFDRLLEEYRH